MNLRADPVAILMTLDVEVQRKLVLDCMFMLKDGFLRLLHQRDPAYYSIVVIKDDIDFFPDLVNKRAILQRIIPNTMYVDLILS